jgi:hypothetical protein
MLSMGSGGGRMMAMANTNLNGPHGMMPPSSIGGGGPGEGNDDEVMLLMSGGGMGGGDGGGGIDEGGGGGGGGGGENEVAFSSPLQQQQQQQQQQASGGDADASSASSYPTSWGSMGLNLGLKLLFYACVILQVVLWPSVMTITLVSVLAVEGLLAMCCFHSSAALSKSLGEYSVLLLHSRKVTTGKYITMGLLAVYMLVFFTLFTAHEAQVLPVQSTWLHPTLFGRYSFQEDRNAPLPGVEVSSEVSKTMRQYPFEWPRRLVRPALGVLTSLPGLGVDGASLDCTAATGRFRCFSAKLAEFVPPSDTATFPLRQRFVPMPAQFYTADVIVTPPAGVACASLEVYRLTLDDQKNVEHGLDYPASAAATTEVQTPHRRCGVFGSPTWCLQYLHAFTEAEYTKLVTAKCTLGGNKQLTLRLPARAVDVQPESGRMGHDLLLVTAGATVQVRWTWHALGVRPSLLSAWDQSEDSLTDSSQAFRDASDAGSVFFKYAIACVPLLLIWYYLAVTLGEIMVHYQIAMTCLFVLLPAVLFFLTVGAWLPMAGCAVCAIAIHHTPAIDNLLAGDAEQGGGSGGSWFGSWGPRIRHALLFLTAICNSIQFVWVMVLVGQAGWSAFLYEHTLQQLTDASSQFIIGGSPSWVGLVLPSALLINLAFLLGAAICVAIELLSAWTGGGGPGAAPTHLERASMSGRWARGTGGPGDSHHGHYRR